jgi:hypothetical protein
MAEEFSMVVIRKPEQERTAEELQAIQDAEDALKVRAEKPTFEGTEEERIAKVAAFGAAKAAKIEKEKKDAKEAADKKKKEAKDAEIAERAAREKAWKEANGIEEEEPDE